MHFLASLAMALAAATAILATPVPDREIHVDIVIVDDKPTEAVSQPEFTFRVNDGEGDFNAQCAGRGAGCSPNDQFRNCCAGLRCKSIGGSPYACRTG